MINIEKNLDPKLMTAKHKKKKSAFTLIELIVVIAIIAILAAALTPSFTGYINEAKKVAVINQAKNVVTAYKRSTLALLLAQSDMQATAIDEVESTKADE